MRRGFSTWLRRVAAPLVVVAVVTAGCTDGAASDKSGGPGPSRVLIMANNDLDDLGGAPAVARFVAQVAKRSRGRLVVQVRSGWRGGGNNEVRVIRDVAAGRADLGWSGTRALDLVGVNAFEPLHAPFLVASYDAEAAVVTDPLAGQLLNSLRPLGLTGLALAADELRMPAAAAGPLLTPDGFRRLAFGTFASRIQAEGLSALGADPADFTLLSSPDGGLGGLETMWSPYQRNSLYVSMPFVTVNAVLWPRTVTIFANTERLRALGGAARGWVEEAAADAAAWSAAHARDLESGQIEDVCRRGARIATATGEQVAALRSAAGPVYARLRADPSLAPTLARVEALVASAKPDPPPEVPTTCRYQPGEESPPAPRPVTLTGPGRAGGLPPGTYRYTLTYDELRAHGVNDRNARANAAVFTWTLRSGHWHSDAKLLRTDIPSGYGGNTCNGWYDVQGRTVSFTTVTRYASGECAPATWAARWSAVKDGLTVTLLTDRDLAYMYGGKTWRRIG
jgi:TRAP-type C4-dicarboxylate transport system substrate-binding protein